MKRNIFFILSPSFLIASIVALSAALDKVSDAFPYFSTATIQLLTSLPSLIAVISVLFSGLLATRYTKKQIISVSVLLILFSGILSLFVHSNYFALLFSSVIFGLGYGGISALSSALISEHYPRELQAIMLGYQSAIIGIGGVLFSTIGEILSSHYWWLVYASYFLALPVFFFTLKMPKGNLSE